ncbi:RIP metalloprotease RseP [Akkermansiaceae bacterium]|nr:RIP metalloprotease RseP [Akkermansiaceae bacterium]MDB4708545.1 RIP metalloprotease RseP [Akkermansiaceae bacterium]MDB4771144.1 RIP metalloprotease RseP [Akkermansiaceae bacterium]MDC1349781.1 RIP metalloprotease RseP [Akkermansiaceae bacterium]
MGDFFYSALLVLVVIALFNFIIFFHELGHFLAARWRGVQVDRFQIWFGKPIWKKEYNGVQYGLGWLPFGGFVALPQMAPMESIEGGNREGEELPKIKPLDKIIVAFAGPLFSILLAVMASLVVWKVGKPVDAIQTTVIGGVATGSAAEKEGLKPGDRILKVNGEAVEWFQGDFQAIRERIMLTTEERITFDLERDGKEMQVTTDFSIEDRRWWQRRALPDVGISPGGKAVIGYIIPSENESPAERADLRVGDEVIEVNGEKIYGPGQVSSLLMASESNKATFTIKRGDEILKKEVQALVPVSPKSESVDRPMLGIGWDFRAQLNTELVYPGTTKQISDSLTSMWITMKAVASPKSKIGLDQLSGPIGIAETKFLLLKTDGGWMRVLAFFVLFNVNLAILNMLPFPVLDGGHIVMAIGEKISGKPMQGRILEFVQTVFALTLISFMLYVTSKDIGNFFPGGKAESAEGKFVWPEKAD